MKYLSFLMLLILSCPAQKDDECIDKCIKSENPDACYNSCIEEREKAEGELARR